MPVSVNLKVPVSIFKEGKAFIAYSPVLDLSTSGRTFAEVKTRFKSVLQIFFQEIHKLGTTDKVLSDLGWRKIKQSWKPPIPVSHELADISIPNK